MSKEESGKEFDAYKETYSQDISSAISFAGQEQIFYTKRKADYLCSLIKNKIQGPIKVLDVGCGHGLIHPFILEKFEPSDIQLYGVDVASEVVALAQKQNPRVQYQSYDGSQLPYQADTFDVAFAICVMHHVPPKDWTQFLIEIKRVLRPGGIVVVFEHNPLNPLTQKIVNDCPMDENAVLLKSTHLRELIKKAHLKLQAHRYIIFTPFDNNLFWEFDQWLGWCPFGAQYFCVGQKSIPEELTNQVRA